jgi:hypothetical protein
MRSNSTTWLTMHIGFGVVFVVLVCAGFVVALLAAEDEHHWQSRSTHRVLGLAGASLVTLATWVTALMMVEPTF